MGVTLWSDLAAGFPQIWYPITVFVIGLKINSVLFYFISTETLLATYCKLSQRITKYQKVRAIISFVSTISSVLLMIRLSCVFSYIAY